MAELDGTTGRVIINGLEVAAYRLSDTRERTKVHVDMAGAKIGHRLGRIRGELQIMFPEIFDSDFRNKLDDRRKSQGRFGLDVELVPGDGTEPKVGSIGTCWGANFEPIERVPFNLSLLQA